MHFIIIIKVCDFVSPYSYRESPSSRTGFLPKIDEVDEHKRRQQTQVDIEVVETVQKGKRKERLKLPPIDKIVEMIEAQAGF